VRAAFKEWAIVVDALGSGDQIVILRKGGISEGAGGFKLEHPRFLLFPTLFHQQRESVIHSAQARYDRIKPNFPPPERVRFEFHAEVVITKRLNSLADANALRGQHIWRDEVIAERFDWGRDQAMFALAVKVFRLPRAIELPMRSAYGGCKSWIELDHDLPTAGSVLAKAEFAAKLDALRAALAESRAPQMKG
jgi:hypothetical protein